MAAARRRRSLVDLGSEGLFLGHLLPDLSLERHVLGLLLRPLSIGEELIELRDECGLVLLETRLSQDEDSIMEEERVTLVSTGARAKGLWL